MRALNRWPAMIVLGMVGLLGSCGQPGAPQPPSLEVPRAVTDLSVTRKGNRVVLRWTPPTRFTDGKTIRHPGPTKICRAPGSAPVLQCTPITTLAVETPKPDVQATYEDHIREGTDGAVMYSVEVLNVYGRSIGLSNQVEISTAPALAPPANISASVGENGVTLKWTPVAAPSADDVRFQYQVQRRGEGGEFAVVGAVPVEDAQFLDQTAEWEKKFEYRVETVTQAAHDGRTLVEGDDSEIVSVFAHDVFPPAPPHEVQAVFAGPGQKLFIDVTWAPNLEPDLAGYNIYRREGESEFVKLNAKLIAAPSYRDEGVQPGRTYFYSVTGVDLRGNESARSTETSERVP